MATLKIKNFPPELYATLKRQARAEKRSVARQVVVLLEKAVEKETTLSVLHLRGLGKRVWKGVDAAGYVAAERGSWE